MNTGRPSVFLERENYRRRRILDAARLLPLLGVALFAIPLLWAKPGDSAGTGDPVSMSTAVLYIFGVWAFLIFLAFLFGLKSRGWGPSDTRSEPEQGAR